MYRYDDLDQRMLDDRVRQFRGQTERYLRGELAEAEFRPLRLQNGLYVQRLAPMLRVAIPYGMLASRQLRKLAHIARHYDKGYAHFSTRQNVQFNWPRLEEVPDILAELASVQMHAIQTSGNCIRNTTADQFSGVAPDEVEDARPYCELIRQWSTFHPEFSFLPRKFKIAVSGSRADRAAVRVHDIGLVIVRDTTGNTGRYGFENDLYGAGRIWLRQYSKATGSYVSLIDLDTFSDYYDLGCIAKKEVKYPDLRDRFVAWAGDPEAKQSKLIVLLKAR